ncbi:hypothetical protein ACRE_029330 [Hapsidospora chrysogenum ATCC 11550]|uniref:Uncharacterized protein n=1 Tax=Hapsidospora chrysogenum (strain ATCC 11550 / CBS 779.69 / DSM 880 / IAM 14645 / JCM 23072 / IMI 49137) TaxID=857340 RepID=A0A086TAA2_HAPC1|nr:hypothetical protein ACRE_029330 [Hapsidospora chrysogenum ATCC 11550]
MGHLQPEMSSPAPENTTTGPRTCITARTRIQRRHGEITQSNTAYLRPQRRLNEQLARSAAFQALSARRVRPVAIWRSLGRETTKGPSHAMALGATKLDRDQSPMNHAMPFDCMAQPRILKVLGSPSAFTNYAHD